VLDDEGWTKSSYDSWADPQTVRYLSKNGQTYTNQFTYDDADRISSTIYPAGGPTVTNIFDTGGNLVQVKRVDAAGRMSCFPRPRVLMKLGRIEGINFGNGAASTFTSYNVSKRLNQILTTIPGGTTIQNFTNRYDAVGNIIAHPGITLPVIPMMRPATLTNAV